ncbi:TonB-dependent receptor [Fluviicola taffensis]|uniref:TonB-dependent receptor plug n=1 Tax=Fluviicola taffensis (strain DSM 16823 / NCIMB 13979 / RW262) TaxID=755732 RepID=F2IGV1_FLUTR|nr:TonB-dependent receptor [Fluviicola taffensis]AEA44732.1 TonB-dependent receptor plug [Fluviicola taffensis DSM 16823]
MKQFLSLVIFLTISIYSFSQDNTIRGFLFNNENSEVVPFEKVVLIPTDKSQSIVGATSDVNGFFTIPKVNTGTYLLKVQTVEFKEYNKELTIQSKSSVTELRIDLIPMDAEGIDEVVISAETKSKTTEVLMSVTKLDKKGLERIPAVGAENDITAAFSVTPGVVTTGDQGGQLYVRGGTPIQNKVLLDGMTIYNPFHSIGFFSIFETELIKNVDIYTGGFDSKYGGRISSVMDITYRDGNKKNFGGKVSVSPFLAKLVVEGPLYRANEKRTGAGSFIFSAKHALLDYTAKDLYRGVNDGNGLPYNFTDIYGKLTFATGQGSKVSVFGFNNYDKVNYNSTAALNFKQAGGGLSWILLPGGGKTFIKGHLTASSYKTNFEEVGSQPRTSSIFGTDLGFDFSYFLKKESQIDYGIGINVFKTDYVTFNEVASKIQDQNNTVEIGAYVNYKFVSKRFVIQPGMRVQAYASLGTISFEPRLGVKYNATEFFRIKLSGGRYSQNFTSASTDRDVVNLFNGLLSAPTNVQANFITESGKLKNPKNGIQYSWHAIFGTEFDLTKHLSLNVEGYFKYFPQLSNINVNKLYEDIDDFSFEDDVYKKNFLIESGKSYGVDVLLKYTLNRLFLWGVYSYGKSTRWDGFTTYAPVFDRRHNINIVASYAFGKKKDLEVNIRWNFGSGLPFTPTSGFYQQENFDQGVTTDYTTSNSSGVGVLLGEFNSKRLPTYHRLDITVKKQFKFKNKTELEIVAAVTNAYNRKNIFYVNRVTNAKIYQFPILPSLGVSYKF